MADPNTPLPLPTHVEQDGWVAESASVTQASPAEIAASLSDEPIAEHVADPAADTGTEQVAVTAEPTETAEETAQREREEQARGPDGKFKRESASERKGRMQAEFNALTRQRRDEERALDSIRRERAELDAKAPKPATPEPAKAEPTTTEPTWGEFEKQGKTWDEFWSAHTAWIRAEARADAERAWDARHKTQTEQAEAERHRTAEDATKRAHVERVGRARAEHPDFDEVIASLGDVDEAGEPLTPQTPFLRDVVVRHDQGHEILYYLGKHPDQCRALADLPLTNEMMLATRETSTPTALLGYFATHEAEVRRIARLAPGPALVALGRITAQLDGAKNGSPPPAPSVTKAKPPIRPVGGSRGAVDVKTSDDLEFGPEFVRLANEEDARRQRLQ